MGMSTWVKGIRPPDDKWKKMKAIWDACDKADIDVPDEVDDFFEGEPPDEKGVVVDIKEHRYSENSRAGIEVYIDELPKDVKIIRFVNAW